MALETFLLNYVEWFANLIQSMINLWPVWLIISPFIIGAVIGIWDGNRRWKKDNP